MSALIDQAARNAAAARAPSAVPSYAPATLTRRFDPVTSFYGGPAVLAQFRAGLARAQAGLGYCDILGVGDSLMAAYMGSSAGVPNDFDNSWLRVVERALLARGIPSGGTGFVRATQAMSSVDSRWTFTGSWATSGQPWASSTSAGATATLTLAGGGGVRVDVITANSSASWTYVIKDSTGASINSGTLSRDGTASIKTLSVTGLTDAASITITAVAGTNVIFSAAISRASGLRVSNQAFYGSRASGSGNWESNTNWYGARQSAAAAVPSPDLLLLSLGTNDKAASATDSSVITALTTIANQWAAASRLLVPAWESGGFVAGNGWKPLVGAMYSLADTLACGLVDMVDRSGGFTAMNSRGYYGSDTTHPLKTAHADIGRGIGELLAS